MLDMTTTKPPVGSRVWYGVPPGRRNMYVVTKHHPIRMVEIARFAPLLRRDVVIDVWPDELELVSSSGIPPYVPMPKSVTYSLVYWPGDGEWRTWITGCATSGEAVTSFLRGPISTRLYRVVRVEVTETIAPDCVLGPDCDE